ncbi:MAG: hypothetical protein ACLUD2_18100 [Clostridium sp.]
MTVHFPADPILCVSRFPAGILAVLLAAFTYISCRNCSIQAGFWDFLWCMIPFYLILTVARSHNIEYLNGILR